MTVEFDTTILGSGGNTAGIVIPEDLVTALGGGKRPPVVVTLNDYRYRNTIAVMGGQFMVGVSQQHRADSGLAVGDDVHVRLELDEQPRVAEVPDDLAAALAAAPGARAAWERLSSSRQREHARAVTEAKKPETRERRITGIVTQLSD